MGFIWEGVINREGLCGGFGRINGGERTRGWRQGLELGLGRFEVKWDLFMWN